MLFEVTLKKKDIYICLSFLLFFLFFFFSITVFDNFFAVHKLNQKVEFEKCAID